MTLKYLLWKLHLINNCPECGGKLKKSGFGYEPRYSCLNKDCKFGKNTNDIYTKMEFTDQDKQYIIHPEKIEPLLRSIRRQNIILIYFLLIGAILGFILYYRLDQLNAFTFLLWGNCP